MSRTQWYNFHVPSCYLSYEWLRAVEARMSSNCYYVLVMRGEEVVGLALCYYVLQPGIYMTYNVREILAGATVLEQAEKYLTPELLKAYHEYKHIVQNMGVELFPVLLCTAREGYAPGILFHHELDERALQEVAQLLINRVLELARELLCATTAFLYVENLNSITPLLSTSCSVFLRTDTSVWITVPWNGFEDYLRSLSRKRRDSVRREMKNFQQSGLAIVVRNLSMLPTDRLAALMLNVQTKYHHNVERGIKPFVEQIERLKRIPLTNIVYAAYSRSEIVGFSLFYLYRNTLYARIVGFDYTLLERDNFGYFNIAFYRPIHDATRYGINKIDYGMGAIEAKLGRGGDLLPTYGYFYFHKDIDISILQASTALITQLREQEMNHLQSKYKCKILGLA